jgi:hypothetical protein
MDRRLETLMRTACELAQRYSELRRLRRLVEQAERSSQLQRLRCEAEKAQKRRTIFLCGREIPDKVTGHSAALPAAIERNLIVNIVNSQGIRVAQVRGDAVFDLAGQKLYRLKGNNIYRLSGELVGHLPPSQIYDGEKRLDRSADKLFPVAARRLTPIGTDSRVSHG